MILDLTTEIKSQPLHITLFLWIFVIDTRYLVE